MARFWERSYYDSYGNYSHYRFMDFRAECIFRRKEGHMCGDCTHPKRAWEGSKESPPECVCDLCPFVEHAEDRHEPDAVDYSEGEQPILMVDRKFRPWRGMKPKATRAL